MCATQGYRSDWPHFQEIHGCSPDPLSLWAKFFLIVLAAFMQFVLEKIFSLASIDPALPHVHLLLGAEVRRDADQSAETLYRTHHLPAP